MPEEKDDEEQTPLAVNVAISDVDDQILFDAINSVEEQDRPKTLLRWARLGHLVSGLVEVETNQGTLAQYFPDLAIVAEDLKGSLDDHLAEFRTKSMGQIGTVGENWVLSEMSSVFEPNGDHFTSIASTGHEADLRGTFTAKSGDKVEILIEVKNYTNTVEAGSVTKFKKDIINNKDRIKAAIFISLKSDITAISALGKPLHFEISNGIPTIYITQSASSQKMFLAVWAMLRYQLGGADGSVPHVDRIALSSALRLRQFVTDFNDDMGELSRMTSTLKKRAQVLRDSADELILSALEIEVNVRGKGQSFRRLIESEALGLSTSGTIRPPHQLIMIDDFRKKWLDAGVTAAKYDAKHARNLERLHMWLNYGDDLSLEWISAKVPSLNIKQDGVVMITIEATANDLKITPSKEALVKLKAKGVEYGSLTSGICTALGQKSATIPPWIVYTFYGKELVTEPLLEKPSEESAEVSSEGTPASTEVDKTEE